MKKTIYIFDDQPMIATLFKDAWEKSTYIHRAELKYYHREADLPKFKNEIIKRIKANEDFQPILLLDNSLGSEFPKYKNDGALLGKELKGTIERCIYNIYPLDFFIKEGNEELEPKYFLYSHTISISNEFLIKAMDHKLSGFFSLGKVNELPEIVHNRLIAEKGPFFATSDYSKEIIQDLYKIQATDSKHGRLLQHYEVNEKIIKILTLYSKNIPSDQIREEYSDFATQMSNLRDNLSDLEEKLSLDKGILFQKEKKDKNGEIEKVVLHPSTNLLLLAIILEIPETLNWLEQKFGLKKIR